MKNLFFLLLICTSMFSYAQSIQGFVVDASGNPLPFATVQLQKADSSIVKVETTKNDGSFRFTGLQENNYRLVVSFIGYQNLEKQIDLEKDKGVVGKLEIKTSTTQLGEVTISAEKPMIEVEPDKTVFNVNKNLSTTGDNGVELLRKAPGLQIDNDDNIILEGKSGINVYINGKQTYLQGQDLSNYLKSLRAEEIEKVEIITQPSSKYDAAGSAGILNIVLKREKGLGTKGSLTHTITYGKYFRNNTTLNVNHRSKKFALFGIASFYDGASYGFFNLKRTQQNNIFDGETTTKHSSTNGRLNVGGDYYLSDVSTVSVNVNGSRNDRFTKSNSVTPISNVNDPSIDSTLLAPTENDVDVLNITGNINYTYKDTSDRTFSIDLDYVNYDNESFNYLPNFYVQPNNEGISSQNINSQDTPIEIEVYSAKTDYEQKLWKGVFSTGAKVSLVNTKNTFNFYNIFGGESNLDLNRSNTFDYEEMISAAYINYKYQYKKFNFQAGLRAEQTDSEGDLTAFNTDNNKVVKRSYLNWFPSGGITYQPNRNNTTALIYSRRIQRPNYENLNPFESQINELSFRKGNPFLQPQFTDNIKLSNVYKYRLNTSFTFSYISDYFAEVTDAIDKRRSFIQTQNVADQQVYNLSVSYPWKVKEWWNIYASAYGYYTKFTANDPAFIPVDRTVWGGYASSSFNLPKDFKLEISGWYSSPSIWRGTFKTKSIGALGVAVQKNYKKWNAKLSFNDILYTNPWRAENRFGEIFITGTGGFDSRNVSLFLSYSFGQSDVKERRRRDGGAEDEQNRIN